MRGHWFVGYSGESGDGQRIAALRGGAGPAGSCAAEADLRPRGVALPSRLRQAGLLCLHAENLWDAIVGAVVLAVLVQWLELLCTSGFPAPYTRILTLRQLGGAEYYAYLLGRAGAVLDRHAAVTMGRLVTRVWHAGKSMSKMQTETCVGDRLIARQAGDTLVLERREAVERRLLARFARIPREEDLAAELIADRRVETGREEPP